MPKSKKKLISNHECDEIFRIYYHSNPHRQESLVQSEETFFANRLSKTVQRIFIQETSEILPKNEMFHSKRKKIEISINRNLKKIMK